MKFLLDFFPLIAFVGIYFYSGSETPMYPAVQGLMVAAVIQTIGSRLITGKFEKIHLWTLVVTLVFGALTLLFRDPTFVQWKASIIVWLTAAVFFYTQFVTKKPLIQRMLQSALEEAKVPDSVWFPVNLSWPVAHVIFGFLNLYIAFNFSEAFWVKFKLFGLMGLTLGLIVFSLYKLFPYLPQENETEVDTLEPSDNGSVKEEK